MTLQIEKPTALLNTAIARRNIARMADKARQSGVIFRPHFKTHQSAVVGEWFREQGVNAITVSSVDMARYFAAHGWTDILIAFPVNWLQIAAINGLAAQVTLHLLVEAVETVAFLQANLTAPVGVYIKIDTGYHRTGVDWENEAALAALARAIQGADKLRLEGILTHAGHSYKSRSHAAIQAVYQETVTRFWAVYEVLSGMGFERVRLSIGDTPSCSVVDDLSEVDEIRPGNFVFYDLMQTDIGSCGWDDVALAVACPVVAKHPERDTIITYGGAVHLSASSWVMPDGTTTYGAVAEPAAEGWGAPVAGTYLSGLSQEHGIIRTTPEFMTRVMLGDVLTVVPVHSCLTANLLGSYLTLEGETIPMMRL